MLLLWRDRYVGAAVRAGVRGISPSPASCSLAALSIALKFVACRSFATSSTSMSRSMSRSMVTSTAAGQQCYLVGIGKGTWPLSLGYAAGMGCHAGGIRTRRRSFRGWSELGASTSPAGLATSAAGEDVQASPGKKSGGASGGASYGSTGVKTLRLSKLLADRAVGTRTEINALVQQGRVKVDGSVVKSAKKQLPTDCILEVNGQKCGPIPILVAFHKPKGVITTLKDEWDRQDLTDVVPKSLLLKHHPVGRLDGDSSGLLLFSSDGALTHKLLNPRYSVQREYVATVDVASPTEEPGEELAAALEAGVKTADGVYQASVLEISGRDIRLVVREGKNRMVRRMLANAGYPVLELRRERYGDINLGDLPEGELRPVSGEALSWARLLLEGGAVDDSVGEKKEGSLPPKE